MLSLAAGCIVGCWDWDCKSLFRAPAPCLATARRLKLNMCSELEGSNIAQSLVYAMVDILSLYVDNIWYSDVL